MLQGFIMGFFAMVFRGIVGKVRLSKFKKDGIRTKAVVKNLKSTNYEYKKDWHTTPSQVMYTYTLSIYCDGKEFENEYLEVLEGESPSQINIGEEFDVYFDKSVSEYGLVNEVEAEAELFPVSCVILSVIVIAVVAIFSLGL